MPTLLTVLYKLLNNHYLEKMYVLRISYAQSKLWSFFRQVCPQQLWFFFHRPVGFICFEVLWPILSGSFCQLYISYWSIFNVCVCDDGALPHSSSPAYHFTNPFLLVPLVLSPQMSYHAYLTLFTLSSSPLSTQNIFQFLSFPPLFATRFNFWESLDIRT